LICSVVLVPHVKLLKLTSYMICGTRVGVPVGVDPIRMGARCSSLAFWPVAVIKTLPTLNSSVTLLLTDLASRALAIGVVIVVWRPSVAVAPSRSPTTATVAATEATRSAHGSICRGFVGGAALQKHLSRLKA
jgi:hypothetical protein